MNDIFKISCVGIITAIICILVKNYRNEFLVHTRISGILIIFGALIGMLVPILQFIERLAGQTLPLEYIEIMLKSLEIAYLTQITSTFCTDCGENGIATTIDAAGKIEIVLLSLPLIEKILTMSEELLL